MPNNEQILLTEGLFSLVGRLLNKVLRYTFLAIVTYLVPTESFGIYTWALSIVTLIYGVGTLSLFRAVSYFVPQYLDQGQEKKASDLLFKITVLSTVSVTFFVGIFYWQSHLIISLLNEVREPNVLVLLLPLFYLYLARDFLKSYFQSLEKIRYSTAMTSAIFPISHIVSLVILIQFYNPVLTLVAAVSVSWLIAILAGLLFTFHMNRQVLPWPTQKASSRRIINYTLPLAGSGSIGRFTTHVDILLLGALSAAAAPGFFRLGLSVASLATVFPYMFSSIAMPIFSRLYTNPDRSELQSIYVLTSRWRAILAAPVTIYLIAIPTAFVTTLFDSSYADAAIIIPVLVLGYGLSNLMGYRSSLLKAAGRTKLKLVRDIIVLGINVVLDVLLIPQLGVLGAAIGTSVSLVAGGVFDVVSIRHLENIQIMTKTHLIVVFASLITYFPLVTLRSHIPDALAVFLAPFFIVPVYIGLLFLLGGIREEDLDVIAEHLESIHEQYNITKVLKVVNRIRQSPLVR